MADLVERLRTGMGGTGVNAVMQEAADEIERLRDLVRRLCNNYPDELRANERTQAENDRLRAALRQLIADATMTPRSKALRVR